MLRAKVRRAQAGRNRPRRVRALAAVAAGPFLVGCVVGCGVSPRHTLSATSAAAQISSQLRSRYPGAAVSVSCPSGVTVRTGATFTCPATLDEQPLQINAKVTGSSGRFTITPAKAIIPLGPFVVGLERDIYQNTTPHTPTTATCGTQTVVVVAVQGRFTCTATLRGEHPRQVTVTVLNLDGNDFSYSLSKPPPT